MTSAPEAAPRATAPLTLLDLYDEAGDPVREILDGLTAPRKRLSPKFFYDERGSALFEEITRQPEYYPTRTELGILEQVAGALRSRVGEDVSVIEFGAGASRKIRLILESLEPQRYVPMDISGEFLLDAATQLAADYPWLDVAPVRVDHSRSFPIERIDAGSRRLGFFPGSSIGNFDPAAARLFLRRAAALLGTHGYLLIGVDLKKDAGVLHRAYNDAAGVTAAFNLNALTHLNALMNGDLDPSAFAHLAFYNQDAGRIEMHLRSLRAQQATLAGTSIRFRAGETIHTENSWKYAPDEFLALAAECGFGLTERWSDAREWFGVFLLRVDASAPTSASD